MGNGSAAAPLPGADLVEQGVRDLAQDIESIESLVVSIGAPRLSQVGVSIDRAIPDAEERLFRRLQERHGDAAHSRYNSLVRRLVSFERAATTLRPTRSA